MLRIARNLLLFSSFSLQASPELDQMFEKLFGTGGAMSGFTDATKQELQKQKLFNLEQVSDNRLELLKMFDFGGSMLGFSEKNKLEIFRAFCNCRLPIDAKIKFLERFTTDEFLSESEEIKVLMFKSLHPQKSAFNEFNQISDWKCFEKAIDFISTHPHMDSDLKKLLITGAANKETDDPAQASTRRRSLRSPPCF